MEVKESVAALTTVAGAEDAERIARAVVERGLAACVNVLPQVVSIYRWKGKVEREEERLLLIKTTRDRFEALRLAILELHPYDLPELVALPIVAGHPAYLDWLDENSRPGSDGL